MKLALLFALCLVLAERPAAGEEIPVANVRIPKDFQLELLYMVPRASEGSWVTMCVDPQGRLIVGDQNGKLYRYTPPPIGDEAEVQPDADRSRHRRRAWTAICLRQPVCDGQ